MTSYLRVDSALTYATSSSCSSIHNIPPEELRDFLRLPQESFQGHVELLQKELPLGATGVADDATNAIGCELQLKVNGNLKKSASVENVFDATSDVDEKMAQLAKNTYLRGAFGLSDLILTSISVHVDPKKQYKLVLVDDGSSKRPESQLTQHGPVCSSFLNKLGLQNVFHELIPDGVNAGERLTTRVGSPADTAAFVKDLAQDCGVMLSINAEPFDASPSGKERDAMSYLKAMDANLDTFLDPNRDSNHALFKLISANVELHTPPLLTENNMVLAAQLSQRSSNSASPYNTPTKQITLGILAGLSALCAMLALVVMKKKRHEQHCEDKHRNASQAAQIRRVSIRMASAEQRQMEEFVHEHDYGEDEEEKEEEYDEEEEEELL
jgi:hypothetical protein